MVVKSNGSVFCERYTEQRQITPCSFERIYFEYHLRLENGSMTRLAERTGIERTHLYRKLKQLGVEVGRTARKNIA